MGQNISSFRIKNSQNVEHKKITHTLFLSMVTKSRNEPFTLLFIHLSGKHPIYYLLINIILIIVGLIFLFSIDINFCALIGCHTHLFTLISLNQPTYYVTYLIYIDERSKL